MKIAMIGQKRIPSGEGGVEKTVEEISRRLVERGHTVTVYNRSGHNIFGIEYDRPVEGGSWQGIAVRYIKAPEGRAQVPVYSRRAVRQAVRDGADVIMLHASGSSLRAGMVRRAHIPCICMLHGIDSRRDKWGRFAAWYLRRGERAAMTRADACIVLSENMKKELENAYGGQAIVGFNGVDKPETVTGDRLLKQYGLTSGEYILWTGRLVPEKGLQLLIPAFKNCNTEKKLVIAGGKECRYPSFSRQVEEMAAGDSRIIMTGYIARERLSELYQHAYACVYPSLLEGMSHALLEALSCGRCCLVSDIPENTETAGDHAVTFRSGDVTDLQSKLQQLLDEPEMADSVSQGAAEYITAKYSWEKSTDQIETLCEKMAAGK